MFRCLTVCIVFSVEILRSDSALCHKSSGGTYNLECPLEEQWCCAIDNYNDRCCTFEEYQDQNQFDDVAEGLVNIIVGVVVGSVILVTVLLCCCCCLPFCYCAKARKRKQGHDRGRYDAQGDNALNQSALPIQQNQPLVGNPQHQYPTQPANDGTIYHPHVTVGGPAALSFPSQGVTVYPPSHTDCPDQPPPYMGPAAPPLQPYPPQQPAYNPNAY